MFAKLLAQEFAPYGSLTPEQLDALSAHFDLLRRWNERLNLTRIVSVEAAVRFHYCESLFLGQFLPGGALRVVDIGSGGGFPGIPVAILRPDLEMTLVESHQRKSVFLREAARLLPNVRVVCDRAEGVKESFDWLVSRAVDPGEVLRLELARKVALLIGAADAVAFEGTRVKLPWGENRVLFHVERSE